MRVPVVKPIKELRDTKTIAAICNEQGRPVIITNNGRTQLVIISEAQFEEYENMKARLDLYEKLAEAEAEANTGFEGHCLSDVAKNLMADLN